jgi:hypothetical protein
MKIEGQLMQPNEISFNADEESDRAKEGARHLPVFSEVNTLKKVYEPLRKGARRVMSW